MDPVNCRTCGVGLKRTGRAGRPFEWCEECRAKVYAARVCQRCGSPLPAKRKTHRLFCGAVCRSAAWQSAHRAELKARALDELTAQ